jgi:formate hydrogenlyase subunit 6/NADH:ubiquinone oxidoreductase subunit I
MAHTISDECIGCGACEDTCPVEAIFPQSQYGKGWFFIILAESCTDCGACVDSCPVDAISAP